MFFMNMLYKSRGKPAPKECPVISCIKIYQRKQISNQFMFFRFYLMTIISALIIWTGCAPNRPIQPRGPVQGLIKQFPDNSRNFVIYTVPNFFPGEIPLYPNGAILKGFVYDERDMDLIFRTTDSVERIVQYFESRGAELKWTVNRNMVDPAADHQTLSLPLRFKENIVETFQYNANRGHIFAARRDGKFLVCRIIDTADSPYTIIVQHIRTGS